MSMALVGTVSSWAIEFEGMVSTSSIPAVSNGSQNDTTDAIAHTAECGAARPTTCATGSAGKRTTNYGRAMGRWTASSTRQSPMSHSAAEYAAHLGQLAFFHELNGDDRRQHSMRSAAQRRSKRTSVATIYVPLPQLSVPSPSIVIRTHDHNCQYHGLPGLAVPVGPAG